MCCVVRQMVNTVGLTGQSLLTWKEIGMGEQFAGSTTIVTRTVQIWAKNRKQRVLMESQDVEQ